MPGRVGWWGLWFDSGGRGRRPGLPRTVGGSAGLRGRRVGRRRRPVGWWTRDLGKQARASAGPRLHAARATRAASVTGQVHPASERGSQAARSPGHKGSFGHGAGSPGERARVPGCTQPGPQGQLRSRGGFTRRASAGPRLHAAWATRAASVTGQVHPASERGSQAARSPGHKGSFGHGAGSPGERARVPGCTQPGPQGQLGSRGRFTRRASAGPRLHAAWATRADWATSHMSGPWRWRGLELGWDRCAGW